MSISNCCLTGFEWTGTPAGRVGTLASKNTYITGTNTTAAVLFITDLYGWTFLNNRLLADHYAREADVTVYVPDFFDGDILPLDAMLAERFQEVDLPGWLARHGREKVEPDMLACARALRGTQQHQYQRVAVVGFCYGGWAGFRLGAREFNSESDYGRLVDCVAVGHPSLLMKKDIEELAVPVLILAPEIDMVYTPELKVHTFTTLQANGVPFQYHHFPKVAHACMVRGDENKEGERAAMVQGKNVVVAWLRHNLHGIA
ncbi:putative hydrolase [Stachybotrys elegans]|uniref:Hydrolase n=1 Tax=Stachybotrys elegans TaxID=80388 RepID=A0A8K0SQU5_9HYPO|nr:putative hydrolase [Stachybotrys elegans]